MTRFPRMHLLSGFRIKKKINKMRLMVTSATFRALSNDTFCRNHLLSGFRSDFYKTKKNFGAQRRGTIVRSLGDSQQILYHFAVI